MSGARIAIACAVAAAVAVATAVAAEDDRLLAPPGIVGVAVSGQAGAADTATGFLASRRRVVTVAHVLDSRGTVSVRGAGGSRQTARVARVDRRADLALLVVEGDVRALHAPRTSRTQLLTMVGGRLRTTETEVRRRISARVGDSAGAAIHTRSALELAAHVGAGDSGAPVVGADGRVLGVLFARSQRRPRTAYATDVAPVARLLDR